MGAMPMASLIRGVTVTLVERRETGRDPFGVPTYEETETEVPNVLVSPSGSDGLEETTALEGKRLAYTLAIPKGDQHDWTDAKVRFFGRTFRTVGWPTEGIEANIPLDWNRKVEVEAYE